MTKLSNIRGFTSAGGGGGGGSSDPTWGAQLDYQVFGGESGWNSSSTYDFQTRCAGGMKSNKFFAHRGESNQSLYYTRSRICPFQVNTSTGAISLLQPEYNVWQNTQYPGWSTVHYTSPEGTGAFFYGGNIAWPGQSSYYPGYAYGHIDSSGNLSAAGYNASNEDHAYNMWTQSPPTGGRNGTTGWIIEGGYSNSDSRARYRISKWNNGSWSIGGSNNPSSNTSTCYSTGFTASLTASASGNDCVGIFNYQDGSGNAKLRAIDTSGNSYEHSAVALDSNAFAFQMDDGSVIQYSYNNGTRKFSSYSSMSTLSYKWPYPFAIHATPFSLGNNRFVIGMDSSSWVSNNQNMLLCEINPTTGAVTELEWGPTTTSRGGFYPLSSSYCRGWPVWASDSDTTPTHICFIRCPGNAITQVATYSWPFTYNLS